jgi:acetyl esterase
VHLHGGGFCVSRARNDRKLGMRIAERGFVVLNIDYALAPEHPFPAALEDAVYGTRWIAANAAAYRGDAARVVLEGGSAGANLAAAAALALAGLDDGLDSGDLAGAAVPVTALVLFYGIFSFPLLLLEPGSNVGSAELWNRAYLGPHFTTKLRDPLVSPVFATTLAQLPPTYLSCGSEDSLLGHTLDMTRALAAAGVPTTLSVIEGANHGFAKLTDRLPAAAAELQRAHAWLDEHVRPDPPH